MKKQILTLSLLIGSAVIPIEASAAELPAALQQKLDSLKVTTTSEPVMPSSISQYIKQEENSAKDHSKNASLNKRTLGKLMDDKGCDKNLAASIITGDRLNDDLKESAKEMDEAITNLKKAVEDLLKQQENAKSYQAQVQATINYVNNITPTIVDELPCICKKSESEIEKAFNITVKKVTGWIDKKAGSATKFVLKNNDHPDGINIDPNVGIWGNGGLAIPSYTPSEHTEEAWIDTNKNVVICLQHKGKS